MKCGIVSGREQRLDGRPSSMTLLLPTVAAAGTAGKFRKSEAITRLPMALSKYRDAAAANERVRGCLET